MVKKTKKAAVVTEQVTKKATAETAASKPAAQKDNGKAEQEQPEYKGAISLGSTIGKTVGRNKSGMPWKKSSKRSEFSKGPPVAYLKSMEEKARLKRIRERVERLRGERKNDKQEVRRRQREKAERKKINEFKSSSYQVVSISQLLSATTTTTTILHSELISHANPVSNIDRKLGKNKEVE